MAHYDPDGYMQYETIQNYYKQLDKESLENVVDNMWTNILREYFLNREGFQLEVQSRPAPDETKKSNDVTIRYVKNQITKPLILIEDKRVSLEESKTTWDAAVKQLTQYMSLARKRSSNRRDDVFGIVTVGRYSRFYILKYGKETLIGHPDTNGATLEFKDDEKRIVKLLSSIKTQASRSSSSDSQGATQSRPGSRDGTTASRPGSRDGTAASSPGSGGTGR